MMTTVARIAVGIFCAAFAGLAYCQAYPTKAIRLIVPFGAGQGADVTARIVSTKLSEALKQPIVVDNRPGAAGNIAAELAARAAPDGYTLFQGGSGTNAINAAMFSSLPFDPLQDFVPVSFIGWVPVVLSVNPSFQASTLRDLVELAKAKPRTLNAATSNPGARVTFEVFNASSGAELINVPYKTSGSAFADVIGGQVPIIFDSLTGSLPHIRAGKVRALALSSGVRSEIAPEIPTFAEAGVPGIDLYAWNAFMAPRGTPDAIVTLLNAEIAKVLSDPEARDRLRQAGYDPGKGESPAEVAKFVQSEHRKWGDLIRRVGVKVE